VISLKEPIEFFTNRIRGTQKDAFSFAMRPCCATTRRIDAALRDYVRPSRSIPKDAFAHAVELVSGNDRTNSRNRSAT